MVAVIVITMVAIIILQTHLKKGESLQAHYLLLWKQSSPGPGPPLLGTSGRRRRQLSRNSLV